MLDDTVMKLLLLFGSPLALTTGRVALPINAPRLFLRGLLWHLALCLGQAVGRL